MSFFMVSNTVKTSQNTIIITSTWALSIISSKSLRKSQSASFHYENIQFFHFQTMLKQRAFD